MRERRIPITVVIVDAGPLISLAACNRLTLLECFHRKVMVTDVVQAECLRYPDRIGATALQIWFEAADGKRYDIVDTPLLDDWQAAVRQEQAGDETRPSRGLGDASISWLIQRIQSSPPNDEILLLLSDDAPFGDGAIAQRHPEVYLLSTRQLLQVLQNFDIIESAESILAEIAEAGRSIPPYAADRPGKIMPGVKSQWTDALKGG